VNFSYLSALLKSILSFRPLPTGDRLLGEASLYLELPFNFGENERDFSFLLYFLLSSSLGGECE